MRIAQIMLARGFGGAERAFVDLCIALSRRGHLVLAIGGIDSDSMDALAGYNGVKRERVRCYGTWDLRCRRSIRHNLRYFSPDLVQTHLARASALGGVAARSLGLPTLAITHTFVNPKYYRAIELLVPPTTDQENHLLRRGVPAERIERIPHFRALDPVAEVRFPPRTEGVIKTLGRFVPKKGFDVLLRATAAAVAKGARFRLEIAGDGPECDTLKALARNLGLEGRVSFSGWISDVPAFLANADLFVLPSRMEPFGLVLLEAMACGVPIVSTRVSGPLQILDEGTALFTPPDDPAALATAMLSVFANPRAAADRATAALHVFEATYAEPVVMERYLKTYTRLVQQ